MITCAYGTKKTRISLACSASSKRGSSRSASSKRLMGQRWRDSECQRWIIMVRQGQAFEMSWTSRNLQPLNATKLETGKMCACSHTYGTSLQVKSGAHTCTSLRRLPTLSSWKRRPLGIEPTGRPSSSPSGSYLLQLGTLWLGYTVDTDAITRTEAPNHFTGVWRSTWRQGGSSRASST